MAKTDDIQALRQRVQVERRDRATALILSDEPGYELTAAGGWQLFFPGREWSGPCRVEVTTVAVWDRRAATKPRRTP